MDTGIEHGRISRSARKRQNRKAAGSLAASFHDLEQVLDQHAPLPQNAEQLQQQRAKRNHKVKSSQKAKEALVKAETLRFNQVSGLRAFRADPLAAIKQHLSQTLETPVDAAP